MTNLKTVVAKQDETKVANREHITHVTFSNEEIAKAVNVEVHWNAHTYEVVKVELDDRGYGYVMGHRLTKKGTKDGRVQPEILHISHITTLHIEELEVKEVEEPKVETVVETKQTKAPKLTASQVEVMNELYNLPYVEDDRMYTYYTETQKRDAPYYGKLSNGTIRTRQSSTTLRALEKKGCIRIIELGGDSSDIVELLIGENTSESIFKTHDMQKVIVYCAMRTGRVYPSENVFPSGRRKAEYIERGKIEHILRYWDGSGCRDNVAYILDADTNEKIYTGEGF